MGFSVDYDIETRTKRSEETNRQTDKSKGGETELLKELC